MKLSSNHRIVISGFLVVFLLFYYGLHWIPFLVLFLSFPFIGWPDRMKGIKENSINSNSTNHTPPVIEFKKIVPINFNKMKNKLKFNPFWLVLLAIVGFVFRISEGAPENAKVYIEGNFYVAPPCRKTNSSRSMTLKEAKSRGFKADKNCDFYSDQPFIVNLLGIYPRWNEDGSWNY